MEISEKLKNSRINAGMTQQKVAEEINVSRQTISNWENGKSLPDVISLIKISDLYKVSLDDLLKGDGKIMDKIKKDTDTVKSNQTMMNVGWTMLIATLVFSVWCNYSYNGSNPFFQFIIAAAPWVMMGLGVACIAASISNRKEK